MSKANLFREFNLPFGNLHEARSRLAELEQRREMLQRQGREMTREFRERYPTAPAYPAKYSDRTLTGWRWRRARHRAVSFDLLGEAGRELLDALPDPVRRQWLDFERRRLFLNLALALADYERLRLRDFLAHVERLRELERAGQ